MQHLKFVNWRICFLMSRTGYWFHGTVNWKRSLFTVLSPNLNGNTKSFLLILEMANISVKWHRTAFWNCKSLTWSWTETAKPIMPINCGQVRAVISRTIQKETNRYEWWLPGRRFLKYSILPTFEAMLDISWGGFRFLLLFRKEMRKLLSQTSFP